MPDEQPTADERRALLAELGAEVKKKQAAAHTPAEERILAGFEEVERFVEEHGRRPEHGDGRDIFERLYAVRLGRMRSDAECRALLEPVDRLGLLGEQVAGDAVREKSPGYDERKHVLDELGTGVDDPTGLTRLSHVRTRAEIKAAEEVAQRTPCADFDAEFRPRFEKVKAEVAAGDRVTKPFEENAAVEPGDFFVLDGQTVHVASAEPFFKNENGKRDRRLRVIYDNGTEANLLMLSLQRALYKDEAGRRVLASDADAPPLFGDRAEEGDVPTGTVYVLRSLSDEPFIAEHREAVHKIGVTGGAVEKRIQNAKKQPTFLLAEVKVVATYQLIGIDRFKFEKLLHHFFSDARLGVRLHDRFREKVEPREWFIVPLAEVKRAVELICSGKVTEHRFDREQMRIVAVEDAR